MVNTIDNVYIQTYENIVRHLAQQGTTRLRPYVMERGVNSEFHNWETMGSVDATQKTTRQTATPVTDTPWARRQSTPTTWHVSDVVEHHDPVQMVVDPNSNIARAHGMAMRRAIDDRIIAAATGNSADGDGTPVAFPAGQIVGAGYGSPISFNSITEVTELFLSNDIDPDEPKVFVIGPTQARKLLQLTEATSGDYNALRPLGSRGYVENWMGYGWVVSTRLLAGGGGGTIDCFAMTRKALGLQVNRDITAQIAQDPSISFAWRVYCYMTLGAIRVEDEHIVWCQYADTL